MAELISLVEKRWFGLDALSPPDEMSDGFLQTADNVFVDGAVEGRGGALRSRPGLRAQLSAGIVSTAGTAIYGGFVYRQPGSGVASLIMAAGGAGGGSGGLIHKWDKNTQNVTAISALGYFVASAVQFARLNDYLIMSGNVDGFLRRLTINNGLVTAESMAGLNKPAYTANAVATSRLINLFNTVGSWTADACTTATLALLDPFFTGANTGNSSGTFLSNPAWTIYGGTVEVKVNAANSIDANSSNTTKFALMDDQPGGFYQTFRLTAAAKSNTFGVGNTTRRAVHYRVQFTYRSGFVNDAVDVTFVVYDPTGLVELARQTQTVSNTNTSAASIKYLLFSFGNIDDTAIGTVSVAFQGTEGNTPGSSGGGTGQGGPYVGNVSIKPIVAPFVTFQSDAGEVQVANMGDTAVSMSGSSLIPAGQIRLTYDIGSAISLAAVQNVALGWTQYPAYPITGIRARFGIRDALVGVPRYTNDFQFAVDPSTGKSYATTDLSSVTGSLTAARYFDIHLESDANYSVSNSGGLPFVRIGPLTFAGNLTVGGRYNYRFVEATGSATAGTLLTSPAGNPSIDIIATTIRATGEVTAANATVPTNTGADIIVYREGGTFVDGLYRKVARVSPLAASTGTYYAWATAGTYVFDDYTPDSALISSPDFDFILSDHQNAPTGAYAVGVYAGRLAVMAPAGLFISQLQQGRAAGMYYNLAFDSSAPDAAIQGFFSVITGSDGVQGGGTSTRLVNYLARLWILFPNSIYELGGVDGNDFAIHRLEQDENKGLIAPRAVTVHDNRLWFLAPDGLRVFDGHNVNRASQVIDKALNPGGAFAGSPLTAAGYANGFLVPHAGRLYLGAPLGAGADVGCMYVLDSRGGGLWTRWKDMGVLYNGVVFSSVTDTDDLYLTGSAGMIYAIGSFNGDTFTSAGTVQAVTASLRSRAYDFDDQWLRCQRFDLAMEPADASTTALFIVTGQSQGSNQYTATCYFPSGETDLSRQKIPRRVEGRDPYWDVIASETASLVFRRVALEAVPGKQT